MERVVEVEIRVKGNCKDGFVEKRDVLKMVDSFMGEYIVKYRKLLNIFF